MKNSNVQYETERARYQQRFESVSSQRDTVSSNLGFAKRNSQIENGRIVLSKDSLPHHPGSKDIKLRSPWDMDYFTGLWAWLGPNSR